MTNLDAIQFPDTPFELQPSLVMLGRRGSEAHGTFIPSTDPDSIDDRDLMGICIPPVPWLLGLRHWEGADAIKGCWDVVLYDFRKFAHLLCKQNPNVLSMLWLEDEDYLHLTDAGKELIEHRMEFRDRRAAAASFIGYAEGQLQKMERGQAYQGYMGKKRKELVDRFGYDCKNAAHAIRLLHMGIEYMSTGRLQVRRTRDRQMLIEIKKGEWMKTAVLGYAHEQLRMLREAERKSDLPEGIDRTFVENFLLEHMLPRMR